MLAYTTRLTPLILPSRLPTCVVTGRASRVAPIQKHATSRRERCRNSINYGRTYLAHPGAREPAVARASRLGRDAELGDGGHRVKGRACERRASI